MEKFENYLNKAKDLAQDVRAAKEIRQGISELEALPEFEGSILYKMELEAMINNLKNLVLVVDDNRLDESSVAEEIRKVMDKVRPAGEEQAEATDEQIAIEKAKNIVYSVCSRAVEVLNMTT